MPKFRKKPVVIEAVQVPSAEQETADNPRVWGALFHFLDGHCEWVLEGGLGVSLKTLEGTMLASPGDWIIKGVKGEFYPCKPDIFAETYEPVVEEEPTITFQVGDVVYTKVPYSMPLEEAVAKGLCVVEEDPAITYAKAVINGLREEK